MEFVRRHIEQQVLALSGIALGQIDFEKPAGDPGLFGPASISWKVHGDFTSMLVGGIRALLLQALHPLALAGVWDHSNFREDLLGRLRRTGQFISGTTFAASDDAHWLIERVKRIHLQVVGSAADGRPYSASDPDLLTWVHVAEVSSFLQAHLRYRNPDLSEADQDRYYAEISLIGESLGARNVPKSTKEINAYLQAMRPELHCDERSREILRILLNAPAQPGCASGRQAVHAGRYRPAAGLGHVSLRPASQPPAKASDPARYQSHGARTALGRAQWRGALRTSAHGVAADTLTGSPRSIPVIRCNLSWDSSLLKTPFFR